MTSDFLRSLVKNSCGITFSVHCEDVSLADLIKSQAGFPGPGDTGKKKDRSLGDAEQAA